MCTVAVVTSTSRGAIGLELPHPSKFSPRETFLLLTLLNLNQRNFASILLPLIDLYMADLSAPLLEHMRMTGASQTVTPSTSPTSEETMLHPDDPEQIIMPAGQKKKKKKKSRSAKAKDAAAAAAKAKDDLEANRPTVLCISRNKHWRYISSYHVRVLEASL